MSQGVAFDAAYTVDAIANVRGGVEKHGAYLHNMDITLGVDADELMGWQGASLFGYTLGNYGDALSDYVGDMQGVSNIDASAGLNHIANSTADLKQLSDEIRGLIAHFKLDKTRQALHAAAAAD